MPERLRTLVFGYGNPSRGDDAIGPEFVRRLEAEAAAHPEWGAVEFLTDFQLQVEHALDLEARDRVLFVDASVSAPPPFSLDRLEPRDDLTHTTHSVSPAAVLHVYRRVVGGEPPPAWMLAIRGSRFELGEPMGAAASVHLDAALARVVQLMGAAEWVAAEAPEPVS